MNKNIYIIKSLKEITWFCGGNVKMRKPKMILFDYGQTLLNEQTFNGIKGTQAVLDCCVSTLNHITAEEVQELANMLNNDIGRYNPETQDMYCLEIHNH